MIQTAELTDPAGNTTRQVPAAVYQISQKQFLAVVAVDWEPDSLNGGDQVHW